jgi:hypothetical protein
MEPEGDITDAFDDGELEKTIQAGQKGPWNDDSAVFEDPKFAHLKKELTTAKQMGYQERRLLELQQRTAREGRPKSAPVAATEPSAPWGEPTPMWNDAGTVVDTQWHDRRSKSNTPDSNSPARTLVNARRASDRVAASIEPEEPKPNHAPAASWVISYVPSILAATIVFVAATLVHGLMVGWQLDLIFRGTASMGIAGVLWRRLQAGRSRAMTIGAITYGALFVPSDRLQQPENLFAVFLGLLIVVAGARQL